MAQPSVMLSVTRLLHHMSRIFRDTPAPRDSTTMHRPIERKRKRQLMEKRLAMGHKPDDHEEEQSWGGMTMSGW